MLGVAVRCADRGCFDVPYTRRRCTTYCRLPWLFDGLLLERLPRATAADQTTVSRIARA